MLIDFKGVALHHEGNTILQDLDFQVDCNDFVYIVGKVGSGKSTLLRAIYGEHPIETGEAKILDYDLRKLKPRQIPQLRRQLGIVFQDFQLLQEFTVYQNLEFILKATGWEKGKRAQRIEEVLGLVGLADKSDRYPHELSGGEQQRICIARALLNSPKIILADEPIGNLDVETSRQIMHILQSIREQGTAVVMITHNIGLLSEFPGIVYQCGEGKIMEATKEYNAFPE